MSRSTGRKHRYSLREVDAKMNVKNEKEGKVTLRVFIGYLLISLFFHAWIDCEFNAEFNFAFKYLAIPSIIASCLIFAVFGRKEMKLFGTFARILLPPLFGVGFVLLTGGYVSFLNTVIEPQVPVVVQGKVINKGRIKGKGSPSHYFDIESISASSVDTVRLNVKKNEYSRIGNGEVYRRDMTRGGLGFLYKKWW